MNRHLIDRKVDRIKAYYADKSAAYIVYKIASHNKIPVDNWTRFIFRVMLSELKRKNVNFLSISEEEMVDFITEYFLLGENA